MKPIVTLFYTFLTVFAFGCSSDQLAAPEVPPVVPPVIIPVTPTVTLTGEYILVTDAQLNTLQLIGKAIATDVEVEGELTWKSPATQYDKAGEFDAPWLFTPTDAKRYNSVEGMQKITVKVNWIAVEQITLNHTTLSLVIDSKETLAATLLPENASDKTLVWSSSNEKVATVDQKGIVTAIADGEAVITATAVGNQTATCTVTVPANEVAVEKVTLNYKTLSIPIDSTKTLIATILPENATDKTIVWSSSDPKIATVDKKGVITSVAAGQAIISATSSNDKTATCTVTVTINKVAVEKVTLNYKTLSIPIDSTKTLITTILPENATDKTIVWSSSDPKIATVDSKGIVTPVAAGQAIITATSSNDKIATCTVTVPVKIITAETVTLNRTALSLAIGLKETLTATIMPANTTDKALVWSSSDSKIVSVDPTGIVTAIAAGQAIITVATANNKIATCTITVPAPAKKVYVIGNTSSSVGSGTALFWIDNVLQPLEHSENAITTALFVSGTDTYITGQVWESNGTPRSVYWKNGKLVSLTDQGNNPFPTSIFVSGNDVYVSGFDTYIGENTAGYWKNGQFHIFGTVFTEARSIYISNGDIYMVGRNSERRIALLWKNGVETDIPGMEDAVSVNVSGGHVYAAGYSTNAALYTDGTVKELFRSATYANSMFVLGNDVYICGDNSTSTSLEAWYWHNDIATNLRDGNKKVSANSIYVADQTVYVAGYSFVGGNDTSEARIWINGVAKSLPSGNVPGSSAIGVVVQ